MDGTETLLVLPFGKYRGLSIDDILESDDNYVRWLLRQNWFRHRFSHILNYVMSSVADKNTATFLRSEVTCNPIRSRMQNLFLQEDFLRRFCLTLMTQRKHHVVSTDEETRFDPVETAADFFRNSNWRGKKLGDRWCDNGTAFTSEFGWERTAYGGYTRRVLRINVRDAVSCSVTRFETPCGYDVTLNVAACRPAGTFEFNDEVMLKDDLRNWADNHGLRRIGCDLKPVDGNWSVVIKPLLVDYSVLLRRTHEKPRDGSRLAILIDRYEYNDVTSRTELRLLFEKNEVTLVFLDEIGEEFVNFVRGWLASEPARHADALSIADRQVSDIR